MEKIGIIGAGGQANELTHHLESNGKTVDFYAVDPEYIVSEKTELIDISQPTEEQQRSAVIIATGATALRKELYEKWPGEVYAKHLDSKADIAKNVEIGEGTMVGPFAFVGPNAAIGKHCLVGVRATISHDAIIGDFVTVSPSASVGGNVEIGDGCFIGIGAVISNGVKISEGTLIGAGAVVVKDIEKNNTTVVGNPARVIKEREGWAREF